MIASILNKHVDGMLNYVLSNIPLSAVAFPELTSFLKNKLDVYWSERISGRNLATIQRIWAIKSWTWVIFFGAQ
jgi:DNA repair/transcription protein MET18/MMS19